MPGRVRALLFLLHPLPVRDYSDLLRILLLRALPEYPSMVLPVASAPHGIQLVPRQKIEHLLGWWAHINCV